MSLICGPIKIQEFIRNAKCELCVYYFFIPEVSLITFPKEFIPLTRGGESAALSPHVVF